MPALTQAILKKEKIKKVYFAYWRIQNNPEYIDFYREWTQFIKRYKGDPQKTLHDTDESFFDRVRDIKKKFGIIGIYLVDPLKKIEWGEVGKLDRGDLVIMGAFSSKIIRELGWNKKPMSLGAYQEEIESNPSLRISVDMRANDKDIYYELSQKIKGWREARKVKRFNIRDPVEKFGLYARVWDFRKGHERLNFRQIAKKMGSNMQTTKMRFYKAFELIYGEKYDPERFLKERNNIPKESLKKTCDNCQERSTCRILCPDVIPFVEAETRKQREKQTPNHDFISDQAAYQKWLEDEKP